MSVGVKSSTSFAGIVGAAVEQRFFVLAEVPPGFFFQHAEYVDYLLGRRQVLSRLVGLGMGQNSQAHLG